MARWLGFVAAIALMGGRALADDGVDFFEAKVRPILAKRCESCHGPKVQESGLRLDARAGWERGGDQGAALVRGKPDESLLIKAIRREIDDLAMPPDRKLSSDEVATLVEWVRRGAPDPREATSTRAGAMTLAEAKSWWAFQPVTRPEVPPGGNPIDAFLLDKLARSNVTKLAPRADRRTLIRRASYDLTGLPPSPEDVDRFVGDDSPDAFAKVVDRLLASPHYGERWGRHWLDVVRYADTAGENSDRPLPHAWKYRNGVIESFNRDQPYDEFIRDQIAGDLLAKGLPPEEAARKTIATGFLAIARRFGHDIDKDRHLTYEDVIDTTTRAVLGLSVACARCHDHKYDPISNRDYYALYGIFDSTRFAFPGCEPKPLPRDLVPLQSPAEWDRVNAPYLEQKSALDREQAALDADRQATTGSNSPKVLAEGSIPDGGSMELPPVVVSVGAGQSLRLVISPLGNHGADTTRVEWQIAGADNRRWTLPDDVTGNLLAGNPHPGAKGGDPVWMFLDMRGGSSTLDEPVKSLLGKPGLDVWRNGDTPSAFVNASGEALPVWTSLPPRSFFVHPAADGPVAVAWVSPVEEKLTITGKVHDAHPGGPDGIGWRLELDESNARESVRKLAAYREKRRELDARRAALDARKPVPELAYAVAEGQPHHAKVQLRGDPEKPGPEVPRRWLEVLGGDIVNPATGESGRRELAQWLTARGNPLTARVMVNRVWQHHLGRPLVETPNDFGTRGQRPTHPELLDWLAAEFMDSGWRIKPLHRAIMLSEAYQRASVLPDGSDDIPTRAYARFARRRLDAEEFRDSLLVASAQLDPSPGTAHPFPPESAWSFTQHNPFAASYATPRRTVYQMVQRNRRDPFLALFDGADPNATTPIRQGTTVPTQALYVMNDPFYHEQARHLADRVLGHEPSARVESLYRIVYQRSPSAFERDRADRFLKVYADEVANDPPGEQDLAAWSALGRVLLGSNEFLYLD